MLFWPKPEAQNTIYVYHMDGRHSALWVITYCPPRHMNRRLDENQRGWDLKGRTDMKQGILSRAVTMAPQQIPQYYLLKYSSVTVLALFLLLSIAVVTKGLSQLHTHTF